MFAVYYRLLKPGIVYGNALSAVAGFLFGAAGNVSLASFFGMLIGICLVIGSACVFNNILDRRIDARMARTKQRALVSGQVSVRQAALYGSLLGVIGFTSLVVLTTAWATGLAAVGWLAYVGLYGYAKRRTALSTVVGSISGAMPIVVGYTAATGQFDIVGWLLFLIMAIWQLPHFYAIAIFRRADYAAAKLPIWSVVHGVVATKRQIIIGIILFGVSGQLLAFYGLTSLSFAVAIGLISLVWLWFGLKDYNADDSVAWARRVFGWSLNSLLGLCLLLAIDVWLP